MPSYSKATLVNVLRERVGLERSAMQRFSQLDERSIIRIEKEQHTPTTNSFECLMKAVDLPLSGFIYPKLDDISMEGLILCDMLTQSLDIGDILQAKKLLEKVGRIPACGDGIYRQFFLCKEAHILALQNAPTEQIFPLIDEAMAITYENFDENDVGNRAMVLEEPELLHIKARLYSKSGNLQRAIALLERMKMSMHILPASDKEKERRFIPILLTLSEYLLQDGRFTEALEASELGFEYSAIRKHGACCPEFEMNTARALQGLGRSSECRKRLQHAFFGFMLLGDVEKANSVIDETLNKFGLEFELYGVDKLGIAQCQKRPCNRGEPVNCDSLGAMIAMLRKEAGLSLDKLCNGIYNRSTMLRIEQGTSPGQLFSMEAIMQRLGRDIGLYQDFFLSRNEFISLQLRDRITSLIAKRQFNDASNLVVELAKIEGVSSNSIIRQFIEKAQVIIMTELGCLTYSDAMDKMLEALRVTSPKFQVNEIGKYPLSHNEISILSLYAAYASSAGNLSETLNTYKRLVNLLNEQYKDEAEKARIFSATLFNYSTYLGRAERRQEALLAVAEGEYFAKARGHLYILPNYAFNKGYNIYKIGDAEKSLPLFALANYGASMFSQHGKKAHLDITRKFVYESFGIVFD